MSGTFHNVFLSHQRSDKIIVRIVAKQLRNAGIEVILDEWSFRPGQTLTKEIESNLAQATALVLFWSKAASNSKYVQFEDELAIARSIKDCRFVIQVIRLDDTPLPQRYERLIYHDWKKGRPGSRLFDKHVDTLARSLQGLPPGVPDFDNLSMDAIVLHEVGHALAIEQNVAEVKRRIQLWLDGANDSLKNRYLYNITRRAQVINLLLKNIEEFRAELRRQDENKEDASGISWIGAAALLSQNGAPRRGRVSRDPPVPRSPAVPRTQFQRIITRAGITPWPKLFQNLRASMATDLASRFPAHVAAEWMGHSVTVAAKHYLQTLDSHFEQAVEVAPEGGTRGGTIVAQKPAPHGLAAMCIESSKKQNSPANTGEMLTSATCDKFLQNCSVTPRGLEQSQESTGDFENQGLGGTITTLASPPVASCNGSHARHNVAATANRQNRGHFTTRSPG